MLIISSTSSLLAKHIQKRDLPLPTTDIQKAGLRYERRVVKALRNRGFDLKHNPWFEYSWESESGLKERTKYCCPDVLVFELSMDRVIVIEVKLKATELALEKLRTVYCPVVAATTNLRTFPLIITKHLDPKSFKHLQFHSTFYRAVESQTPVFVWPGNSPVI